MDSRQFLESIQATEDIFARKSDRDPRSGPTHFEKFLKAIRDLPPPPCDDCPLRRKCATKQLACEAFWKYAHDDEPNAWPYATPPTRIPSKAIYNALSDDGPRRQSIRPPNRRRTGPLSAKDVQSIRNAPGTHANIAKLFGVTRQTVGHIKSGRRYSKGIQ